MSRACGMEKRQRRKNKNVVYIDWANTKFCNKAYLTIFYYQSFLNLSSTALKLFFVDRKETHLVRYYESND